MNSLYISIQRLRIALKRMVGSMSTIIFKIGRVFGVIIAIIDAIFPKRPGSGLRDKDFIKFRQKVSEENMKVVMGLIRPSASENDSLTWHEINIAHFLPYQNPTVKNLIWQMKYHSDEMAIRFCADIFYDEIVTGLSESISALPFNKKVALISIPSSSFVRGEKSYDHMREVMNILEKYFLGQSFLSVQNEAIKCNLYGAEKSQHTGKRNERLKWSKSRFYIDGDFGQNMQGLVKDGKNIHVICIDDVTTTGATFLSTHSLIKNLPGIQNTSIQCIALSH